MYPMVNKEDNNNNEIITYLSNLLSKDEINRNILLEQYKIYVEMANAISNRRHSANSFYLTINGFLLTGIFLLSLTNLQLVIVKIFAIFLNITWLLYIIASRNLNWAKYEVINEIEKKLPARGFTVEWNLLSELKKPGKLSLLKYTQITWIAQMIPVLFMIGYFIFIFI